MPFKEKHIDDLAENAKWRFPNQRISHQRPVLDKQEFMGVFESFERAVGHLVNEESRAIKLSYSYGQSLPYSKMRPLERNRLSQADHTIRYSADGFLFCLSSSFDVNADVPHQIKTFVGAGVDESFEDDGGHWL